MQPYYEHNGITFYAGHVLDVWPALAAQGVRVQTVVTSIPFYGLRNYGTEPQTWPDGWVGELGQEDTPDRFVAHIVAVFRAVRPALRPDGTLWLNVGDSYANDSKWGGATGGKHVTGLHGQTSIGRTKRTAGGEKQLLLMPARVALALQADGWILRDDIAWVKAWQDEAMDLDGNAMPYSRQDAFTPAWEHVFLLSPSPRYYFDMEAVKTVSGAHPRNVFRVNPQAYKGAHFACFPPGLVRPCILAGTSERGACPACGAAWRRVVERVAAAAPASYNGSTFTNGKTAAPRANVGQGPRYETQDTGRWQPGCACNAGEPVPCLVADPFLGSGTSAEVAYLLQRGFVGGDLKAEYLQLAIARMQAATPWYARADTAAPVHELGPLFAGVA